MCWSDQGNSPWSGVLLAKGLSSRMMMQGCTVTKFGDSNLYVVMGSRSLICLSPSIIGHNNKLSELSDSSEALWFKVMAK